MRLVTVDTGTCQTNHSTDRVALMSPSLRGCRVIAAGSQALIASATSVPRTHNAALSLLRRRQTTRKTRREGRDRERGRVGRTQQVSGSDSSQDSPAGLIITSDSNSPTFFSVLKQDDTSCCCCCCSLFEGVHGCNCSAHCVLQLKPTR